MKRLAIAVCLLLAVCAPNDGHYRGEKCRIAINGRTGYLVRYGSWIEGGGFLVKYADAEGEIHLRIFQEDELEF